MAAVSLEQLVSLCKRRGIIYPGSEIYGGLQGLYDYGPVGVELKNNIVDSWWRRNVYEREDMEGLDSAILMNPLTWKHSGHEETFVDPLVDCRKCQARWRADQIGDTCPVCGSRDLTEPRPFNLMFKTQVGPVSEEGAFAYLRPETAQGIFVNFNNVLTTTARKLPFGIAQVGKGFRNEINPRNFLFRVREFDMLEIEFFVHPGTEDEWQDRWLEDRLAWWEHIGVSRNHIRILDVPREDLAHYSKKTYDLMYRYPTLGFEELEGIASRTDFDLGSHTRYQEQYDLTAKVAENPSSTTRLSYFDPQTNKHVIPYVVEPSAGVGRCLLAVLSEAYDESMVKAPSVDKLSGVRDGLDAFNASVGKHSRLPDETRESLLAFGEAIAGGLPEQHAAHRRAPGDDGRGPVQGGEDAAKPVAEGHRRPLPDGVAAQAPPGPGQGGGLPAEADRRPARLRGPRYTKVAAVRGPDTHGVRRHRRHRQALPAPGRNRHAALRHGRLPDPRRPGGDGPRPGYHGAGTGGHR